MDEIYRVGEAGGFRFELRMDDGMSAEHRQAIRAAADRWAALVVGPEPPQHTVNDQPALGPVILISTALLDGKGGTLAELRVSKEWPSSAGALSGLPSVVKIVFDRKDLSALTDAGSLEQVAAHEIGHALGFGVSWTKRELLSKRGGQHQFTGPTAMKEYGQLQAGPFAPVPVDRGIGDHGPHWREATFGGELMSTKFNKGVQAISRLTLASLADLGYEVKIEAADTFTLEPYQ